MDEDVPGSPADRPGVRPEDLVVELHGQPVASVPDLQRLLDAELIGTRVTVTVLRGAVALELELEPAELPTEGDRLRTRR